MPPQTTSSAGNTPTALDPQAVSLAKAIRQTESGGNPTAQGKSGEYGAYQYTEPTWAKNSAAAGVNVPLKQATLEQQNQVAYNTIKKWKDAGNNPGQIASMWNAGEGEPNAYTGTFSNGKPSTGRNNYGVQYDVPAYAKSVATAYQTLKQGGQVQADPQNPSSTANQTPTNQESNITGNETPGQAGMNAIANTPGSALNFGKGVLNSVNPLSAMDTISQIPGAFNEAVKSSGGILPAIGNTIASIPGELYKGLVPQGIRQAISGDVQGASKSFQEDPFGNAAPAVLGVLGGARAIDSSTAALAKNKMSNYVANIGENTANKVPIPTGKGTNISGVLDKGVSTVGGLVTKPAGYIAGKVADFAKSTATSIASQLTTLPESGIIQALKSPETMTKLEMDNATRGGLAGELKTALNARLKDLGETGKGYEAVRKSNQTVAVPKGFIADSLAEHGLKIKNGRVVADTNSVTRNTSDLNAINKFYKDWSGKKTLTPNEFLNMRGDLADMAKFDKLTGMGKTRAAETIAKSLRAKANSSMRDTQLQELKALDDSFAPEVDFLRQAKKDYFNPDGTLKDGAGNKIANAGNKAELLKRLENIIPGITKRLQLLKIIEDIKHSNEGFKVGAYTRGALVGGSVLTLNIPAIIGAILTSPGNALAILRGAGYVGAKVAPVLKVLQAIAGDVPSKGLTAGLVSRNASQSQNTGLLNPDRTPTNTPR